MASESPQFASRSGRKLDAALDAFEVGVEGLLCCDFGSNVGGFTDCLLQRAAERVYAIDTGYGDLAWKLRKDPRVVVMERTNALYCDVAEPVDLVVIDMAWTPLALSVPAAARWLKPGGRIVALLKPHYELAKMDGRQRRGPLPEGKAEEVCRRVCERLAEDGLDIRALCRSVLIGKGGNAEFLLLAEGRG